MPTTETQIALDLQAMRASATEACRMMKVLSNPDRLLLLCQMAQGEICVSDLEARVGIGQPTLSQQLGVLRAQELVDTRRDGKNIYYQISNPKTLAIMSVLYEQFCTSQTE
jgi:DNA-binding transcriptional ArsR family regulator